MAVVNRDDLKSYFFKGAQPKVWQMHNFIDSMGNKIDDKISIGGWQYYLFKDDLGNNTTNDGGANFISVPLGPKKIKNCRVMWQTLPANISVTVNLTIFFYADKQIPGLVSADVFGNTGKLFRHTIISNSPIINAGYFDQTFPMALDLNGLAIKVFFISLNRPTGATYTFESSLFFVGIEYTE